MAKTDLTAQRLRELLHYDPETGVFTWLKKPNRRIVVGSVAGNFTDDGYRAIRVDGRIYRLHRLAWLYAHGRWPDNYIDHIDGNPLNNRICNLRDVPQSVNLQNLRSAKKGNASRFLGVRKHRNKWQASITIDGKYIHLGEYFEPEHAHAAYLTAKRIHHQGNML